jgi:hypothetical protein
VAERHDTEAQNPDYRNDADADKDSDKKLLDTRHQASSETLKQESNDRKRNPNEKETPGQHKRVLQMLQQ